MSKDEQQDRTGRSAAIQHSQTVQERTRRILLTLAVLVVLGAVIAAGVIFTGGSGTKPAAVGSLPSASARGEALVVGDNASAVHKVVVYEDFLCPYCRQFESSTRDFLQAAAEKGIVQVEYRPFHLLRDDYSTRALSAWSGVLLKGTPKQALAFHDLLYDKQPRESSGDKPDVDRLVAWAKAAGVTSSSTLEAVKTANPEFVKAANAAAQKAGVRGTPTVIVDGKELQGSSISDLSDNLERLLVS